ncbi:MAG: AMP-binding protein [Anaerolineae bacterium]|nr:AMP-binding protein [Anaerolineae bacterium]
MTFLEKLRALCGRQPAKDALVFLPAQEGGERQTLTYRGLETTVLRAMAYLQTKGVARGDRVALQLPKSLPFFILHLAAMHLEAVSLPLNPGYPPPELRYFLEDAQAKILFASAAAQHELESFLDDLVSLQEAIFLDGGADSALPALLPPYAPAQVAHIPVPQDRDATCLMIYTSGTTGRPKGAELTHGNLTANLDALHEAWGWRPDDVLLHVLPHFHIHGLLVALHGALHAGATALLLPAFDATRTLKLLQDEPCTVFMGVPTIYRRLVAVASAADYDLDHMRLFTSGSDRLPDELFQQFQATFGHTLLERYGMSETGMLVSNPLHGERRAGSVGLPLPGVEVRIVHPQTEKPLPDGQVGAVQVRGANVCKGYWRQPEKTAQAFTADGWLRTGDLGLRAPDGYITLKGRSKDLIISGGYNVYPPEIELVLAAHPAVQACSVVGCPDPEWGERATAVIVPTPGSTPAADELIAFCRERLVSYKVPRTIHFVHDLPRNALGKVQKAQLRRALCR